MITEIVIGIILFFLAGLVINGCRKGIRIAFEEGEWLALKDAGVKSNLHQYIRLRDNITESDGDWFKGVHYFEPDGRVKTEQLPTEAIKNNYYRMPHYFDARSYKLAVKLEDAFQRKTNAQAVAALEQQQAMRKSSLKMFLDVKKKRKS
jgi:hypothetical protein